MNIFFLDQDHTKNAMCHVDRHVVKMPLEACQMLASAYPNGVAPYKHTHINHPMAKWVRESECNFYFTTNYALSLCEEYTYRYDKRHKCQDVVDWYLQNKPDFKSFPPTDPPRCFGEFVVPITDSVVDDYRNYYITAKQHIFNWKKRNLPEWLDKALF
jgi:hypothetical protein